MIVVKCTERDRDALKEIYIDPETLKDDGQKYKGIKVIKPWGYEICRYEDKHCAIWWLHIDAGKETSMHCHPNKATALLMRGGQATLKTLHSEHELTPGVVVIIEAGAFHRTTAKGPTVLYEMEMPNNKRDLVRLQDSYNRGQGYENVKDNQDHQV